MATISQPVHENIASDTAVLLKRSVYKPLFASEEETYRKPKNRPEAPLIPKCVSGTPEL
jgi:hypothetical protein